MMWISTDTSQEPGAWSPERKGSDPWPLASGAAFIDVIINHADKGRLDFHFTPLTALPLPLLIPFPNPFPWHFFPSLCQYPRKPYFDSYGVAMARNNFVCLLRSVCLYNLCASPMRRPTVQIRTPSIGDARMDMDGNWAVQDSETVKSVRLMKRGVARDGK